MRSGIFRSWTIHAAGKQARSTVVVMAMAMATLFVFVGVLSAELNDVENNGTARQVLYNIGKRTLDNLLGQEIPSFALAAGAVSEENSGDGFLGNLFYALTDIDPNQPVALLSWSMPGMAVSDYWLAGGNDPSPVPPNDPTAIQPPGDQASGAGKETGPAATVPSDRRAPVVYIYHTHNREAFLPMLPPGTPFNDAYDATRNVTLVGDWLTQDLDRLGVPTLHTTVDYWPIGDYSLMYKFSRETVKEELKRYQSIRMVFDIHRDSDHRPETTRTIGGQPAAAVFFIIGGANLHYDQNLLFAKQLQARLDQMYPGLSRGIWVKQKNPDYDTLYNQDLFSRDVLIEIGGPENTEEELRRTDQFLANAIAAVYHDMENSGPISPKGK